MYYLADEEFLYNPRLNRKYEIRQGIPVMLIDEAVTAEPSEHDRIQAKIAAEGISPTFAG